MGLVIYSNAGGDGDLLLAKPSLPCKSISAKEKDKAVDLTWEDPDSPEDTSLYSEWASTRIVRKEGGFPVDENDGVTVVTSTTKNEYKDASYIDGGLTNGTTYYYRAFTCYVDGMYNTTDRIEISATPRSFRTMTVTIDLNDSNPETCGSYADDAISMPYGKTEEAITAWQDFFGYKPCLFKDGKVVGYLNPNDYSKFEDGTPADITSGDAGDVMVEFPRRGLKISKANQIITVSMTDAQDDPNFTYYAHMRGSVHKEYFYLGAYCGSIISNKLRSLSNNTVTRNKTISAFRQCAHDNGSGYEQMTWFQWMFLQVMYVLQFRGNLNSQSTVGIGYNSFISDDTGVLDKNGLIYGTISNGQHIKLFAIEDLWGYNDTYVDGIATDNTYILTTTNDFNDDKSGYARQREIPQSSGGYISDVVGSSELGFYPSVYKGSSSSYFCDQGYTSSLAFCSVGGYRGSDTNPGIFAVYYDWNPSISNEQSASRLSYY